jgi:hypothetical protein
MSTTIYKGILSFDKIGAMKATLYVLFKGISEVISVLSKVIFLFA